jgi:hypothetical protein
MRFLGKNYLPAALGLAVLFGSLLLPTSAMAQGGSAITGQVTDATGGILPGVVVEATSPALIEGVRTAVTGGQGRYTILELRPGTYNVTFTLPGFSVVLNEGLELPAAFSATVNAEMSVGGVEETITVAGESPVVDIQNVRQQNVFTREELDNLPTNRSVAGFATLTLGATLSAPSAQNVGGDQSEALSSASGFSVHGSRRSDQKLLLNGMQATDASFSGNSNRNAINPIAAQELVMQIGGISAESETGGMQINVIPREGGNDFSLYFNANGTNGDMQTENLNQEMKDRGLETVPGVKKVYDVGYALGGPIIRDKMWFFVASRWWGSQKFAPGNYSGIDHNKFLGTNPTPGATTTGFTLYAPDTSKPAFTNGYLSEKINGRITLQASEKNKFTFGGNWQQHCDCRRDVDRNLRPSAVRQRRYGPSGLLQMTWTNPVSNRLLLEGGATFSAYHSVTGRPPETTINHISISDQSSGFSHGSGYSTSSNYARPYKKFDQWNQRFSLSYVTGSHAFKVGVQHQSGINIDKTETNHLVTPQGLAPVRYRIKNNKPNRVYQYTELQNEQRLRHNLGLFVQDQWTMDRLTLTLGLRYGYYNAYVPAQKIRAPGGADEFGDVLGSAEHGRDSLFLADNFGPDGDMIAEIKNVPNWSDWQPRVGFAYDLTGNGTTAVKASMGRYIRYEGTTGIPRANNMARRLARGARRSWKDTNGNYYPDCDLTNYAANGECKKINNDKLGSADPYTTYDPDVLNGNRRYNWQANVSVEHELKPGLAVDLGWFRTSYHNPYASSNRNRTAANYDTFCLTAPTDAKLGATSGKEICGFYDLKPAYFGTDDEAYITQASNFGDQTEVYNGVDLGITGRFGDGGMVRGGFNYGRTVFDFCDVMTKGPQIEFEVAGVAGSRSDKDFCRQVNGNQSQIKFASSYPLPFWGIELSGTYQNLPGVEVAATLEYDSEDTTIGRDLNDGDIEVALMKPYSEWGERISQLDIRLGKRVDVGGASIRFRGDVYNLFNSAVVLAENSDYGDNWRDPSAILGGRLLKFGILIEY